MQRDIKKLSEWLYDNLLTMNTDKTKYIFFHSYQKPVPTINKTIEVNGTRIERVTQMNYLGLIIDTRIGWAKHIEKSIGKIVGLVGVLRRLNTILPVSTLKSVYFSHIHSKMFYLSEIWGGSATSAKLDELQVIQNRALRNIFYIEYYINGLNTNEIRRKYKIMNVREQIEMNCMIFIYKVSNKLIKTNHILSRSQDIHEHYTRGRDNINTGPIRTNHMKHNIFVNSSRLFNKLDRMIRNIPSLNVFKRELKKRIFST